MYEPGGDAGKRYPDWVIRHRALGGIPEVLCRRRKVILIETGMTSAERRCALAHAIAHLDLDHQEARRAFEAREERHADHLAARRLICLWDLADTRLGAFQVEEWAESLGVTAHILRTRVDHLHPAELAYVKLRLQAMDEVA